MGRLIAALVAGGALVGLSLSGTAAAAPAIPWHACADPAQEGFQCAKIRAPLNYERPRAGKVKLALIRHRATDPGRRVRTLFYEPGGPGVSGTEFLPALAYDGFPTPVQERFDIVSWDPRGVGASTAVECFASTDAEDAFFAGSGTRNVAGFPVGQEQMTTWIDRYRGFGERCERRNGRLLKHVSTVDTVRDLNRMRRRAGDRKLNYLGTSYGTIVGAVYANTFPDRVRRMVLDGVVNPTGWTHAQRARNDGLFLPGGLRFRSDEETAQTLDAFLELCGSTDTAHCAFSAGSPEATKEKFADLLTRLPVDAAPGQTSYATAISSAIRSLYFMPAWSLEGADLQKLWEEGPSAVTPPGPRPDDQEMAIVCGEVPSPGAGAFPGIDAFAQQRSGVVGPFWAWDYEPCSTWPVRAAHPYRGRFDHRTANPVLVIGNTFDPATPLRGAKAMARALARARLLTVDGYGHTALINPSTCVHQHESRYFVTGTLPPKGTRCAQDAEPFGG
jgi:pimeloyl-ACP methyl ester carboxylesterase